MSRSATTSLRFTLLLAALFATACGGSLGGVRDTKPDAPANRSSAKGAEATHQHAVALIGAMTQAYDGVPRLSVKWTAVVGDTKGQHTASTWSGELSYTAGTVEDRVRQGAEGPTQSVKFSPGMQPRSESPLDAQTLLEADPTLRLLIRGEGRDHFLDGITKNARYAGSGIRDGEPVDLIDCTSVVRKNGEAEAIHMTLAVGARDHLLREITSVSSTRTNEAMGTSYRFYSAEVLKDDEPTTASR